MSFQFNLVIVCIHPREWGFTNMMKWLKHYNILEGMACVCAFVYPHQTLKLINRPY